MRLRHGPQRFHTALAFFNNEDTDRAGQIHADHTDRNEVLICARAYEGGNRGSDIYLDAADAILLGERITAAGRAAIKGKP